METRKEIKFLIWTVVLFLTAFFLPVNSDTLMTAIHSTLDLTKWYAREHIVLCLLPAFFIAGVIAVFVSQGAVLKYFGANAKKWVSYTVASVSGASSQSVPVPFSRCSQVSTSAVRVSVRQ